MASNYIFVDSTWSSTNPFNV